MCNPYDVGWLATSCAVEFTTTEGIPLNLAWYMRDTSDSPPEVLPGGFINVNQDSRVRSELNFTLTETPDTFEGHRYFCRVSFSNGTVIQDSQEFYLFSRDVIMNVLDFPTCVNDSIQSAPFEECIDPIIESTPQPTTVLALTSIISTPLPSPTATPTPPDLSDEDSPDNDVNIDSENTALTSTEEILIYSAIGVAVFLFLVVFLLVVCVCVWNSAFRQSKYCTCCSS